MTDKEYDNINKWKLSGYNIDVSIHYIVTDISDQDTWPIVFWDREGDSCDVDYEDFEIMVEHFVKDYGLTQLTLWDTYREHSGNISVSRRRRENV